MAFAAITILMDTLHQNFLLPTPRFPLRNKSKVTSLYRNLSALQTCLEQDFKVGECDEAIKALEAQIRDASIELRFQIEAHLTLFYLGKAMKLRLESAKKLLPILNRAIEEEDIATMDFGCMMDILMKHFALPVSRGMPPHIKKRVKSFRIQHVAFLSYEPEREENKQENKEASEDELETEEDTEDEWEREVSRMKNRTAIEQRRYMLCEAETTIRQELRAPSYLNKYMKQRIQARQRIRQIFMLGFKLTSHIKKELLKVKNAYHQSKNSQNNNTTASLRGLDPERNNITVGEHTLESPTIKMVSCDDQFNMIMDNLNQQSNQREIVSIVGMGGIGKTTLARRIYGDDAFISRFDCRAWVTISQEYNPTKVFKALLLSLAPRVYEENNEASHNELAELVYKCLKRQRYLVVIDDIWSTDVWSDLQKCFPDDNNQSRMLLTTRLKNVAEYAGSESNFCHTMRFLDLYESWNLFHNKMLPQRVPLSHEFERVGREIVEKCKGLPLAISVVAGLLSNSKQDLNEWECIAKKVHSLCLDHSNQQCENIIDLSYTFLPHHLKHCFLALGVFPEDNELIEDVIVVLWVSQGFLKVLRSKSLEDVAREALQDLVDRNLLIFREMNGGLSKAYQMHDVLRELALREAQKENILCFNNTDVRLNYGFRRIQRINSSSCISQPKFCSYHSLSHTCNTFLDLSLSIGYRYTKQLLVHCKFLRGLLLSEEDGKDDGFMFTEFMGLVHLRLLGSDCIFKCHSLPWFMLWNLQILLVVGVDSIDQALNISGLPQLKILNFTGDITLVPPRSVHHNLESIGYLDYRSCTEELFMRIPNLRTLAVVGGDTINLKCEEASSWFESLAYLYKLEDLEICGEILHLEFTTIHSMGTLSIQNFLPNLKKLKLSNTTLNWEDMFVVGMLSKLEVLIILTDAVVGKIWEPKDGGFHRLKFLCIFDCDLQCWEVSSGHFPVLECLLLMSMHCLERIPSGFADIVTLKSIKLYECSESIISSAKSIQEEQQEYGNNAFAVDILRNDDFYDNFWGYDKLRNGVN